MRVSNGTQHILVVDDTPLNVKLLADILRAQGYEVRTAADGAAALADIAAALPALVLLDVMMPGMSGFEVCERIRANEATALLPVVLVTALDGKDDRIHGIEAGADDFLTKPISRPELLARVRSLLRIKELHDKVAAQKAELQGWNELLEERVREGLAEVQKLSHLKRFFSPGVAQMILDGQLDPMRSHRSEITVVFLDLRGFTAFSEAADPEEVIALLREYHATMGELIAKHEGTVEHFAGDGIMIFFNDPMPLPNPAENAVRMALEMHEAFAAMATRWNRFGYEIGMGIGIAQGYATMGLVGFEGRFDYGAVGAVCSLAARLCAEAAPEQILVQQRIVARLEGLVNAQGVGKLQLKGFPRPVPAFEVRGMV